MSGATSAIRIEGLSDARNAVRELGGPGATKALRLALNAAMDLIVNDARPRVPRRTGRAAASLKASSTGNRARISAGGTRARYFPWLDFGGRRRGRGGGVAVRPFYRQGRYVWVSLARKRTDVIEALETAVADVARQVGFEVT